MTGVGPPILTQRLLSFAAVAAGCLTLVGSAHSGDLIEPVVVEVGGTVILASSRMNCTVRRSPDGQRIVMLCFSFRKDQQGFLDPRAVAVDDHGTVMVEEFDRGGKFEVSRLHPLFVHGVRGGGDIETPLRFADPQTAPIPAVIHVEGTDIGCIYVIDSRHDDRKFVGCSARARPADAAPVPGTDGVYLDDDATVSATHFDVHGKAHDLYAVEGSQIKPSPLELPAPAVLAVRDTPVSCAVSERGGARSVTCSIAGKQRTPAPGSYRATVGGNGAVRVELIGANGAARRVYPLAAPPPPVTYLAAGPGISASVTGTNIRCTVSAGDGGRLVRCGPPGGLGIFLSQRGLAAVERSANGRRTVVFSRRGRGG